MGAMLGQMFMKNMAKKGLGGSIQEGWMSDLLDQDQYRPQQPGPSANKLAMAAQQSAPAIDLKNGPGGEKMPEEKPKRQTTGVTTHGRRLYNNAMKKLLRDNPLAEQPELTEWVRQNAPKHLVGGQ